MSRVPAFGSSRMELRARDVVCPHHRGHRSTVVGLCHQRAGRSRRGGRSARNKHAGPSLPVLMPPSRVLADHRQRIPAHVRNFEARVNRLDGLDVAFEPAKPGVILNSSPRSAPSAGHPRKCRATGAHRHARCARGASIMPGTAASQPCNRRRRPRPAARCGQHPPRHQACG
mgnify:CR=1 FL=1